VKTNIALVYGGRSGEHEVSLVSAASIARHLAAETYDITLIGIDLQGAWYLQDEQSLQECRSGTGPLSVRQDPACRIAVVPGGGRKAALRTNDGRILPVDLVFPALHGSFGEDGTIQGLFEMADLPYVGSDVLGSAIGMDKEIAKALWHQAGLPVLPYLTVHSGDWSADEKKSTLTARAEQDFGYPLFVKPARAGSSVGAGKANDRRALQSAVAEALRWDTKVLIEPFVVAQEVECSVTGNDRIETYIPGEIVPSHEFYDYEAKYLDPDGAVLLIPAQLAEQDLARIREIAATAYRTAELSGLARVDFFVRKDTGQILLNEVNTMPGFTAISMFPKMCAAAGLAYGDLLDRLIALAQERYALRSALRFSLPHGPSS